MEIIVAHSQNRVIGKDGSIPWHIPCDLKRISKISQDTTGSPKGRQQNAVIMGRKTWLSIPEHRRPLNNRINIVVSATLAEKPPQHSKSIYFAPSWEQAIHWAQANTNIYKIFIFGGESIYHKALASSMVSKIWLTRIHQEIDGDTYFPDLANRDYPYFTMSQSSDVKTYISDSLESVSYSYQEYVCYPEVNRPALESTLHGGEYNYLYWVEKCIKEGIPREDRTGTGTLSLFGCHMQFDLSQGFPLLTTKKMFTRGILEELLWFLRGETDAKTLQDKKVRIWDGNSSREYLDSIGLHHLEEGDCGPIYGFNFRHFGGEYVNSKFDHRGRGFDQLAYCLDLIKNNPTSRRILINLWNPCDLDKVALPACHVLYQFFVANGTLSCSLYQRSGDMGLGVPFNIASASFLTHILARLSGLRPHKLVHTIGDAHVYTNHVEALQTQITRVPYPFPSLEIADRGQKDVQDFTVSDFIIRGYTHHPAVKMAMAV
jgi:dihydrofolate reductase/thymidylate synthase